jgi:hypothetical protein
MDYPRTGLEGIRKTMKISARIFRDLANFGPGMSKYKSEIFLLEPTCLVLGVSERQASDWVLSI